LRDALRRYDRRGGDKREQPAIQHQPHQLIAQQAIVIFCTFPLRQLQRPDAATQIQDVVVQFSNLPRAARVAQALIPLHATRTK
jgi:hypothetical protein